MYCLLLVRSSIIFGYPGIETSSLQDEEAALKLKKQGNELVKQKKHKEAIAVYTEALTLEKIGEIEKAFLYCNRSFAYGQLNQYKSAVADAKKAIGLYPTWFKGYWRKGQGFVNLGQYEKAEKGNDRYSILSSWDLRHLLAVFLGKLSMRLSSMSLKNKQRW